MTPDEARRIAYAVEQVATGRPTIVYEMCSLLNIAGLDYEFEYTPAKARAVTPHPRKCATQKPLA